MILIDYFHRLHVILLMTYFEKYELVIDLVMVNGFSGAGQWFSRVNLPHNDDKSATNIRQTATFLTI